MQIICPNSSLSLRIRHCLCLLILPFTLHAETAPESAAGENDEVLGRAGDFEIRLSEVQKSLENLNPDEKESLRKNPASLNHYVRALLVQQIVLREAAKVEWEKSAPVAERMRVLRDGVVATTFLESVGQPPASYPNEAELTAAYTENRDTFLQKKAWKLGQIFIAAPRPGNGGEEPAEALARQKRITEDLKKDPTAFESLAQSESEDPASAAQKGEIGWLPESRIHPDILAVLPGMKLSAISPPVRMDDGWHFIKVLDIREAYIPTLQQIQQPLAQQLRTERARAETEAFLARLLEENPVAVNEMVLSKVLPPAGN
jgi:hypothetical protein